MAAAASPSAQQTPPYATPGWLLQGDAGKIAARNYTLNGHRRDELIDFMRNALRHSFVLNLPSTYAATWASFEALVEEYRTSPSPETTRLKQLVPTVGKFHTHLPLQAAWLAYDTKYAVSMRRHLPPSFPEIRHTLNLAQVMALSQSLEMITFDGDQVGQS